MSLRQLIQARELAETRVNWCAIFIKAYAIVASRRPALRRAYIGFPYPRLYDHPSNVASFSLERDFQGEKAVFFTRVYRPEQMSLVELSQLVSEHKERAVETIPSYRSALMLSRLPRPVRRWIWWLGLNTDGPARAKHFGTFAVSVVASLGAASLFIYSPLTTTVNYGVFDENGNLDVRITYDHRVMDGGEVARAIMELERVLQGEILDELLTISRPLKATNDGDPVAILRNRAVA